MMEGVVIVVSFFFGSCCSFVLLFSLKFCSQLSYLEGTFSNVTEERQIREGITKNTLPEGVADSIGSYYFATPAIASKQTRGSPGHRGIFAECGTFDRSAHSRRPDEQQNYSPRSINEKAPAARKNEDNVANF